MIAQTHSHRLTFLGTGACYGVPSFYCGCKACKEALDNPKAARDCSGILIAGKQNTLIDAAPELRRQLVRERVSIIDQALFTHGHFDHVGGIPQLEFYVKLQAKSPIPIYAGEQTIATIRQQYAFMLDTLDIRFIKAFDTVCLDGVRYTALPAAHSRDCYGFLIEVDRHRTAYFPDTGPLPQETLECLQGLDTLIIDSTFSGANWKPGAHHSIDEAIALAGQLKPGQTFLTHLAMHFEEPITLRELEQKLSVYNGAIQVAYDGLTIEL